MTDEDVLSEYLSEMGVPWMNLALLSIVRVIREKHPGKINSGVDLVDYVMNGLTDHEETEFICPHCKGHGCEHCDEPV